MTKLNRLEEEMATEACKLVAKNRVESCDGDKETAYSIFGPDPTTDEYKDSPAIKAAAQVALRWIEDFRDWFYKLSPAEKCTVWPPAGSCGHGLYNMSTKDIVEKFISKKTKEAGLTSDPVKEEDTGIIASNGLVSPPNEPEI